VLSAALVLALTDGAPKTWYGPATATFPVAFAGDPADPSQNDVRVLFTGPDGPPIERLAFWDEATASWSAVLVTDRPGTYVSKLFRNGKAKLEPPAENALDASRPLEPRFLGISPLSPTRFGRQGAGMFFPIGYTERRPSLASAHLAKLTASGGSYVRLIVPEEVTATDLEGIDALVKAAEAASAGVQFVLWDRIPGSETADGVAQARVRTFVARYAHSPALLAWEVSATPPASARETQWHSKMTDSIRSLDPYGHLIAGSQGAGTFAMPRGTDPRPLDRPALQPSPTDSAGSLEPRRRLRRSLLHGLTGSFAGAICDLDAETLDGNDLFGEFENARLLAKEIGLDNGSTRSIDLRTDSRAWTARGAGAVEWVLLHLESDAPAPPDRVAVTGLPFADGTYPLTTLDLDSRKFERTSVTIVGGRATFPGRENLAHIVRMPKPGPRR
jgi:hypothetical protein